jgi:4,5-DOPA dioxygenase extradiol
LEFIMSKRMPVVFVSHGAPDALLKSPDTVAAWREMSQQFPKPAGILAISAHWEANHPTASMANTLETIHDFSGFSPELYRMKYPVQGAPELAKQVASLLSDAGLQGELHPNRGLDHGAWVPLTVMFPNADIPVTQLSLIRNGTTSLHYEIGKALAPLRDEGILILTSGAITHNFGWLNWHADGTETPNPKAQAFGEWVADQIATHDDANLVNYRRAPNGAEAHPTEEHFLPLFVALGAANADTPSRYRPRFAYGALSMDAYLWADAASDLLEEKV